jgi:hypothetical protein
VATLLKSCMIGTAAFVVAALGACITEEPPVLSMDQTQIRNASDDAICGAGACYRTTPAMAAEMQRRYPNGTRSCYDITYNCASYEAAERVPGTSTATVASQGRGPIGGATQSPATAQSSRLAQLAQTGTNDPNNNSIIRAYKAKLAPFCDSTIFKFVGTARDQASGVQLVYLDLKSDSDLCTGGAHQLACRALDKQWVCQGIFGNTFYAARY